MNTAQCKAFICDPNTAVQFPDFNEIQGATYIQGILNPNNWKRVNKKKTIIEFQNSNGYDEVIDDLIDEGEYPVNIVDTSYSYNQKHSVVSRVFAHIGYECLDVTIYTDKEDGRIVAFSSHID